MANDFVRNIKGVRNIKKLSRNITTENDLISTIDNNVYVVTNDGYKKITWGEIEQDIELLETDVETLKTSTGNNTSEIETLKTSTGNNTSEIETLKTSTGNNTSEIETLKTSTGNNTSEIETLKTSTGNNTSEIETLKTSTGNNTSEIDDLKFAYRHTKGTNGSEEAINTIIGYKDNDVVSGVRGSHVQQGSKNNENIIGGVPDTVGVDAKNVIDPNITNAHYAFIGGYDNVNNALAGTLMGYHCYISDLATHGAIYGGSYHKILDGDYAFIGGGTKNLIQNNDGGNYGFLLGGNRNKLYGRFGGILGGMNNRIGNETSNKDYSSVVGSYLSSIDGNHSTVLNGNECKATKDYTLARGKGAVANNIGESVFSTGKFKTAGDSGQSTLHLLRRTTTGVETQLLCDDSGSSILTPIGVNTTLTITGVMSGHRVDSEGYASFKFTAVLTRSSETLVVQYLDVEKLFVSDESYNMNIKVNPTLNSYQILAQGVQGHTINWTAKVDTVWSRNI